MAEAEILQFRPRKNLAAPSSTSDILNRPFNLRQAIVEGIEIGCYEIFEINWNLPKNLAARIADENYHNDDLSELSDTSKALLALQAYCRVHDVWIATNQASFVNCATKEEMHRFLPFWLIGLSGLNQYISDETILPYLRRLGLVSTNVKDMPRFREDVKNLFLSHSQLYTEIMLLDGSEEELLALYATQECRSLSQDENCSETLCRLMVEAINYYNYYC